MIGYEFEFLVREGNHPLTKETFKRFHEELHRRGWVFVFDPGTGGLLGSTKDGFLVTTDDGVCIMEINAPPCETIHECDQQMRALLKELQMIYHSLHCSIIGVSVFPGPFEHPYDYLCDKSYIRYYNPIRFEKHWPNLLAIASNHVWLDVPQKELLEQWKFFNRLTSVLAALFGNGPIFNEQNLHVLDGRDTLWHAMLATSVIPNDQRYFGMPETEFETVCHYFDFMLSVPVYYLLREGKGVSLIDKTITYGQFLKSTTAKATYFDGTPVTISPGSDDFFRIQQITFPHVRIKYKIKSTRTLADILFAIEKKNDALLLDCFSQTFLECRCIGAQPEADISAGPAFLLGLQESSDARALLKTYSYNAVLEQYRFAIIKGFANDMLVTETEHLIAHAESALRKRGKNEEVFLAPLFERVKKRLNPGSDVLQLWDRGGLDALYASRDFTP